MYREVLRHPVKSFRTTPLGSFISLCSGALGCLNARTEVIAIGEHADPLTHAANIASVVINAGGIVFGELIANRQHERADRVRGILERNGFQDKLLEPMTEEWCDRQSTRVVCEEFGVEAAFKALCEHRKDEGETYKFKWVPHF